MTTATADQVQERIIDHVRGEVECRLLSEDDGRIGCVTPLQLANGDSVVVWVQQQGRDFEVTDYGEALADFAAYVGQERKALEELVYGVSRGQGVQYVGGRLTARGGWEALGELVWRVAAVAAQVSEAAAALRPRRRPREDSDLVGRVERVLQARHLPVERDHRLTGRSGHKHSASIFVPPLHAVLEPVGRHWNQVTATYVKFGDLMHANGFRLYSVLDDRPGPSDEEVAGLLVQVSQVVEWSRHDEWLEALGTT